MVKIRGQIISICCTVVFCALAGCADKGGFDNVQGQAQTAALIGGSKQEGNKQTAEQLQSLSERLLVVVFIALLEMDKKADLSITGKQAEQILPVVNAAISQGELSLASRKVLLETLDTAQKNYYDQVSGQMKKRAAAMDRKSDLPPGQVLTEEERQAVVRDLEQRRSIEPKELDSNSPRPPRFGERPLWDSAPDKNVEQQLVELLKSKLDPSIQS
jgi:hypothetical protein